MTESFLSLRAAKLLILAGPDRLDRDMMVAQMQGKLQVEIIDGGHSIQEDAPERTAQVCIHFAERNRFAEIARLNARTNRRN